MDEVSKFIVENTQADSFGAIVVRGIVWLILVTIFAVGAAQGKSHKRVKSEAGLFLAFIIFSAVAIYVSFGFIPTLTSIASE